MSHNFSDPCHLDQPASNRDWQEQDRLDAEAADQRNDSFPDLFELVSAAVRPANAPMSAVEIILRESTAASKRGDAEVGEQLLRVALRMKREREAS